MAYSTGRLRVGDTTYTATLLSSATCPLFTTGLYLAFDEQLQRPVAIKQVTVPDTGAKSKDILTRIRDEARLMDRIARGARAKNPHLVLPSVHDLALDAQSVSIKMDVVPGERLDQTAAGGAPATAAGVRDAVALASDVCAVLTLLHSRRYAHRDVAPKNIMVRSGTTRPHATLLDFGLAVVASIRPALFDGEGTLGYRAPEQTAARDRGIYPGPPSDVYSLAAVLYELLTGTALGDPMPGAESPAAPLHALNPLVPPGVGDVLLSALAWDPTQRPRANDFARRLRLALDLAASMPSSSTPTMALATAYNDGLIQPPALPRYANRDTYTFEIAGPCPYQRGDFVWVGLDGMNPEGERQNGFIVAATAGEAGRTIDIKFEQQVNMMAIAQQGIIGAAATDVQYRMRVEALTALRDRRSHNPHLLRCLVDQAYRPLVPHEPQTHAALNDRQRRVLTDAPRVEDLYLVMGPPGTGKTETITALVSDAHRQHKRVLITSKVNRAVDNVLEKLGDPDRTGAAAPDDLTLIRLGHEDRVAEDVRHLLIDERAQDLQQRVAEATDEPFAALAQAQGDWASLVFALEHLRTSHARWSETTAALEAQRARIADLQRAIWQRHAPVITDAHAAARQAADQAERAGARARQWRARNALLGRAHHLPLVGTLSVAISGGVHRRTMETYGAAVAAWRAHDAAAAAYAGAVSAYQTEAHSTAAVLAAKRAADHANDDNARDLDRVRTILSTCSELGRHLGLPMAHVPNTPAALAAVLAQAEALIGAQRERDTWRYTLLDEWRAAQTAAARALSALGAHGGRCWRDLHWSGDRRALPRPRL